MPGRIDPKDMDVVLDHVKRKALEECGWQNADFNDHGGMSVEAVDDTYEE